MVPSLRASAAEKAGIAATAVKNGREIGGDLWLQLLLKMSRGIAALTRGGEGEAMLVETIGMLCWRPGET
jgi:hypothetical protein